ncbi:hypothetical protein LSH36_361g02034 [Paralvinella palmiformis]|uniref:Uncharacterized protein n=1 Tax=Paralvinella palmiformis TaxID=53620 RepID=A0AAD9N1F0_9ANNE|nr:hypothetical protein LSH36_361g02034 [Paralvinella palmiformis]
MEAQAQSVLAEEDQQEVIYLVVDENPQGQQVTQIVSDGQLIGQQAQIIMQDGKQAVLITDGNQQQVVLLDDEVGPEQLQSALHHGAVQQNVLQQPPVSVIMTQPQAAASTSTANGGQVQYLVTEGGEIISPITQVNQPVVTIASQQPPQQQQHHQLVVTQSGLVRISGGSNKKDGGIVPGKSLINQAALKEAAAKSPRGRLEDQVLIMGASGEAVKTQLSEQTTLREVIGEAVDKQITGMVPTEPAPVVPTTDTAATTTDMDLAIADANAEINSTGVSMDAKESKDETDTIGFTEETNTDMAEAVEPDSTQSGCTDTVNGSLDKDMINSVSAVDGSSMVSVSSDIPPLAALPDQVMEDDEENKSADEAKNMQVPQVFNMPDQTMELNASEIFHEKEQVETKLTSDDSATEGNATEQNVVAKPTSTLIIHDPQGKKQTQQQEVMPSTVITVISPQSKKKKRRYDLMRQEEQQLESPQQNSAKATKMVGDSIASRRERRTSKPTRYYGLEVDYEVYTADIYRSYRRGSESGDEVAVSKAKKEQRKNIEDNFGFDIPSTDDEQPPEKKKAVTKPKKSEITQLTKESPLLPGEPTPIHNTMPITDVAEGAKITVKEVVQQPVKRGRGRPPKHPRKSLIKVTTPKKVEQVETSPSKETASEDKVSKPVETLAADQSEETSLKTDVVAADVEPAMMENGLDGLEDVLKKDHDDTTSTSEFLLEEEKVLPKEADEVETEQIMLNVHENEAIDAMMTPDSAEGGEDSVLVNRDLETVAAETSEESVLSGEPVKDVETPVISDKMAAESETGDEKMNDNTFVKPTKRGSIGRPRGRTKKSTGASGQPAKRSSQSDGESPRRSVRTKEKPCYAESSEEEGQEAVDVQKDEVITPEQLREESNKVYSLQKEVTDLKFINDSLELRLAQQSGSPEEIRSLQARVDSLQMRNNELEAKLKNYEKSQKIGINIKGMKFSIKKDSTSSQVKSKPTDVVRLKEIELAEQELRVRETQLEKRELKARALDRELDERGAQLTKRESKLDRWERKLRSQEKEIEYKERRLKRLENDLQDLGGTGGRHKHFDYVEDTELIVQQKDLRMWEDELRQREAEMLEKEKLLAATEKQLMALNTELNEKAEYLQAKEQSHSSGDEGSLTDISEDRIKRTPFKARHSEGSKKTKGKRQNSSSSLLMTWKRSTPTSEVVGLSSHLPSKSSTPKSSAKSTPKTTAKAASTGKRKVCTDSKNSTPASVKRQKTTPKSSGKKKILKSPAFKANKEKTPKSRKSEGKVQKKKLASNMKSPKTTSKAKRK